MKTSIHISRHTDDTLRPLLDGRHTLVLTDAHVARHCLPHMTCLQHLPTCIIDAGEKNKSLTSAARIWDFLTTHDATRNSLLVCLGGGMTTDVGGFAASTYMRGIDHINVATTLLAAVDASIGGKTAINHHGVKNLVGTFRTACHTIVAIDLMRTLDKQQMLSGYAEMLKHALLDSQQLLHDTLALDLDQTDETQLAALIERNVDVKRRIVDADPTEHDLRKILNFGHTVGHALESISINTDTPMSHGHAVARGIVAELYISHALLHLPREIVTHIHNIVNTTYGTYNCPCNHIDELIKLMHHDKKRTADDINFTLLSDIGQPHINCTAHPSLIEEALLYL